MVTDATPRNSDTATGIAAGRWGTPRNEAVARPGTVHEDSIARRHGYEAATVAGAVHLEQFLPLLLEAFGEGWWRSGWLSVHCVAATLVGEPVRCYLQPQGGSGAPTRARVWMNTEGESLVLEGTASLGADVDSELSRRRTQDAEQAVAPALDVRPGAATGPLPLRIEPAALDARLPAITEPLPCYRADVGFGGRVAPPSLLVAATRQVEEALIAVPSQRLEVFGGLEVRYLNGPVLCGRDYRLQGRVLEVHGGRDTDVVWYQADVHADGDDGRDTPVASVIRMDRIARPGGAPEAGRTPVQ